MPSLIVKAEPSLYTSEPVPTGTHLARCISLIDIGTVTFDVKGETKQQHKIRLTFEIPDELRTFKEEKGEQPMVISEEYGLSLHENSNLRAVLQNWRGAKFTEEELDGFDLVNVVGVPCLLNVIHETKKGKVYARIAGISPLVKGMKCPDQVNPSRILTYTDWDEGVFGELPNYIQEKMKATPEYQALNMWDLAAQPGEVNIEDINF